jgi:Cu2+-exporting ATPase
VISTLRRNDDGLTRRVRASTNANTNASPCKHCSLPVAFAGDEFCCVGCESVYHLLLDDRLDRYYHLAGGRGAPARRDNVASDRKLLDELAPAGTSRRLTLDVQGIHCAACVWLFQEVFAREADALSIVVNPTLGKLDLTVGPAFAVGAFVDAAERFGYRLGPSLKADRAPRDGLLARMGITVAIAMNAMLFAIAMYSGLDEGPLFVLFRNLELGLGALSVFVGGSVFFRSAFHGLKRGLLPLDVPIALGIALAFGSSVYAHFSGPTSRTYFDTLTVFVALMLVGRWLQERLIERNRRQLLASDGAEGLLTRRIDDGRVAIVRCAEVAAGDHLLIAPGDLVPVDGELVDASATCSLDWINGESAQREFREGAIPAGAFNAGASAFTVRARTAFARSPVVDLLRVTRTRPVDASRATPWWRRFAQVYVGAVLLVATAGFLGWILATGDLQRSLEVTAGVLIVTCPCAFGIATPMAYELTYAGLRRAGLFVRAAGFLDRAEHAERVVFDKTGTLTTGTLTLASPHALDALDDASAHVLYNLAARSSHPKSVAIARALASRATLEPALAVREQAGVGLVLERGGHVHRLGGRGEDVVLFVDDEPRVTCTLREEARGDAGAEVSALSALGYEVWILSGDTQARVDALASELAIPRERALGGRSPSDKAAFVDAHPHSMMIGDGINDALAVESAFCSGTPAIDRPFLPARADFYFTTAGLGPVTLALRAAKALSRVTKRNLRIAVAYNAVSVGLAWAGLLSPLACAVIMPISSLTIVSLTMASLSQRSALWRS